MRIRLRLISYWVIKLLGYWVLVSRIWWQALAGLIGEWLRRRAVETMGMILPPNPAKPAVAGFFPTAYAHMFKVLGSRQVFLFPGTMVVLLIHQLFQVGHVGAAYVDPFPV